MVTVTAHYDGERILLDEPLTLRARARLLVTLLPDNDAEHDGWLQLSGQTLAGAYARSEPEYPAACVREANPEYDGG